MANDFNIILFTKENEKKKKDVKSMIHFFNTNMNFQLNTNIQFRPNISIIKFHTS